MCAFVRFAPVARFPTLCAGGVFSRACLRMRFLCAWHRLHFFPRPCVFPCLSLDVFFCSSVVPLARFPALGNNVMFCFELRLTHCALSVCDWLKWLFWFYDILSFVGYVLYLCFPLPERPCWLPIPPGGQTRWGAAPEQVRNERTKRHRRSL